MSAGLQRTASSRSIQSSNGSCSSSSSSSSFWDAHSGSDSDNDAHDEYSEWRDCLRGMEAKYPRGVGTAHTAMRRYDAVELGQSQGLIPSSEGFTTLPKEKTTRPDSGSGPYLDDPPSYDFVVQQSESPKSPPRQSDPAQLPQTKNGSHLALFQSLAEDMQKNPHVVIHSISQWLMDPQSPQFWVPFGLSIRGLAHEQLDRQKHAKRDYAEGLRRFYQLRREQEPSELGRLAENVRFMEFRILTLGGVIPTDRTRKSSKVLMP